MSTNTSWLTPNAAGDIIGWSGSTMRRVCKRHPGFGVSVGSRFKISSDHIKRLLTGDTVEQIVRDVRSSSGEGKAA